MFGDKPIYLPFHPTDPCNAAARLARLELQFPVPADQRRHVPLFVSDAAGTPMYHAVADAILAAACLVALGAAVAPVSPHTERNALASLGRCPPSRSIETPFSSAALRCATQNEAPMPTPKPSCESSNSRRPCIAVSNTGRSRGWREGGVSCGRFVGQSCHCCPCLLCRLLASLVHTSKTSPHTTTGSLSSPAEVPKLPPPSTSRVLF